ncbi:putative RNA-directed DNA polymerase [Helianthus annuus]|nr:putative RNA-directed DNA polymerase [Helianthus annuus]
MVIDISLRLLMILADSHGFILLHTVLKQLIRFVTLNRLSRIFSHAPSNTFSVMVLPSLFTDRWLDLLSESGITYHISCPYTPPQNGVAERKNRHLSEVARALLFHSHLPKKFWYDAYATAAYLINRLPSPVIHYSSPFETLFGSSPDYSFLRTFGCLCYPFLGDTRMDKLSPKSIPCIFVGYAPSHLGYLCMILTRLAHIRLDMFDFLRRSLRFLVLLLFLPLLLLIFLLILFLFLFLLLRLFLLLLLLLLLHHLLLLLL